MLESVSLLLIEGLRKFIVMLSYKGSKLINVFTIMSLTNHCLGSHYESGFHFAIKVLIINGKGCLSFERCHYDFWVRVWEFVRVVQLKNVFTVKRNDVKSAWLQILQFSPSSYIIYSPHGLFPNCPHSLFVPLFLHIIFPYPLILSNYSLFQNIHAIPYSYLGINSLYPNPNLLLILGLNSPTKTSFHILKLTRIHHTFI